MPALSASTFAPRRCAAPAARRAPASRVRPALAVKPESDQYFDLKDLESTTGSWDVYGVQDTKRYAALQNTFFERAAAPVTRRETLWSVLLGASVLGFPLAWGGLGSRALSLPISKGPQGPGEAGPKGKK